MYVFGNSDILKIKYFESVGSEKSEMLNTYKFKKKKIKFFFEISLQKNFGPEIYEY